MDNVVWIGNFGLGWIDIILILLVVFIVYKLFNNNNKEVLEDQKDIDKKIKAKLEECKKEIIEANNSLEEITKEYKELKNGFELTYFVIKIQNAFIRELQNANIEVQSFSNLLDKLERMTNDISYVKQIILENEGLVTLVLDEEGIDSDKFIEFLDRLNETELERD